MRKIRYRALVRGFSSELGHQFQPLIALGYGGKLWFDHHADGRHPSVSLHRLTLRAWCAIRLLTDSMILVVLTELYSTFVISQVVRDDVAPAELAHLHSEVVRYLGTSRNNRLSA